MTTVQRIRETSTTTGTGDLTLDGAVKTFSSFDSLITDGDFVYFAIENPTLNEWEIVRGILTIGTPSTISRDAVLQSSNADALVNFSAGTKQVYTVVPTETIIDDTTTSLLRKKSILFINSAGELQQDNPQFFWDQSNSRLGIGTMLPKNTLHIVGDANDASDIFAIKIDSNNAGAGNPGGIDMSSFAVDEPLLKAVADAITTAGTASHQIPIDIGGTTYYLVAYTHGS